MLRSENVRWFDDDASKSRVKKSCLKDTFAVLTAVRSKNAVSIVVVVGVAHCAWPERDGGGRRFIVSSR
jgi:hypothetical protein